MSGRRGSSWAVLAAGCAAVVLSACLCGCNSGDARAKAQAFSNRGTAHLKKGEHAAAIAAFKKAIAIKADCADAYHNRAVSYAIARDYEKVWADVKACRKVGGQVDPAFLAELRKASGREE